MTPTIPRLSHTRRFRVARCSQCGRQFGTASIAIHLKACAEKWERERGEPAPPAPALPGSGGGGSADDERPIKPATSREWAE